MVMAGSMSLLPGTLAKVRRGLRIFVETGTGEGGGIQQALDEGFDLVFSIDGDNKRYLAALARFEGNPKVNLVLGDSRLLLASVLKAIAEPCVIFLDAHTRGENSPLVAELGACLTHPFADTILVDDLRRYADETWAPDIRTIERVLGPLFILSRVDNCVAREDVLVAVSRAV